MSRAQIIDQDPGSVPLFYRDLRDVGLLDFSACLLGEGLATPILRQPCLGRVSVSPARGDGDGHTVSWSFQAFVLWQLSLAVFWGSSESQSSSGRISASVSEQRDRSLLSTELSWPL